MWSRSLWNGESVFVVGVKWWKWFGSLSWDPIGIIGLLRLLGNKWCNCSNKINICEIFILFWINTFSIWTVTLFVLHFLKILNIYYYITLKSCNGSNKINILQIFILFWINTFSIWTVTFLRKKNDMRINDAYSIFQLATFYLFFIYFNVN